MPSAGRIGTFWFRPETTLGTSAGVWYGIRPEEVPTLPTSSRNMIANANAGHKNPYTKDKPVAVQLMREGEISFSTRIRRAGTAVSPSTPICIYMLQSAGWNRAISTAGTISSSGSSVLTTSGDIGGAGQCVTIECEDGLYRPALIISGTTSPYTIAAATPSDHQASGDVLTTYTASPLASYDNPYLIKSGTSGNTLQLRYISGTPFADSSAQNYHLMTGCAMASMDAVEIGAAGTFPLFNMTFNGYAEASPSALAAIDDDFQDNEAFGVVTSTMEFQYGTASDSALGASRYNIESVSIDMGINSVPVMTNGSGSTVGGASDHIAVPTAPKITINTVWDSQSSFESGWFSGLSTNTSKYMHIIQPTSSPGAAPAWGFFMPNAHIEEGGEPTIDYAGDIVKASVTFTGSTSPYGDGDIDTAVSAPIFFCIS